MSSAEPSLKDALAQATQQLQAAGVDSPWADAQALAAQAMGLTKSELSKQILMGAAAPHGLAELVDRRAAREPLQHITGVAYFRQMELLVGPGVFVPRPETESVAQLGIDAAAQMLRDQECIDPSAQQVQVVDLCTGSGAMALAIAAEVPQSRVVAAELSADAVRWARRNVAHVDTQFPPRDGQRALADRVEILQADVAGVHERELQHLVQATDIVLANPPYIPTDAVPKDPEVTQFDPAMALYGGGEDGLLIPGQTMVAAAALLRPGGLFVMEHADVQGAGARHLAQQQRDASGAPIWAQVQTIQDLTGRDRALVALRR